MGDETAYWVTWRRTSTDLPKPLTFTDKVELFRERIWGWQLYPAHLIAQGGTAHDGRTRVQPIPHAGFSVLQICSSYFETIGKYASGYAKTGESRKHFTTGLERVFPLLREMPPAVRDAVAKLFYEDVRCGLYHVAFGCRHVILSAQYRRSVALHEGNGVLLLNPHVLPVDLMSHLDGFCAEVLQHEHEQLGRNFERRFDFDCDVPMESASAKLKELGHVG